MAETDLEQYKMHREEVMLYIQQIFRTELSALLAVGAVYAWLIHEAETVFIEGRLWYVPSCVILLAGFRCSHLVFEMQRIGMFLSHIENVAFKGDGWEHFKRKLSKRWSDQASTSFSTLIWISAFLGSAWMSNYLYHHQPHAAIPSILIH